MYKVRFYPPENTRNNTNVTIHWNLEKNSMTEFSSKDSRDDIILYGAVPFTGDKFFNFSKKITKRIFDWGMEFINEIRGIEKEDLESMTLDLMPGFRLKWYYTGDEVYSEQFDDFFFKQKHQDVEFVRIVDQFFIFARVYC